MVVTPLNLTAVPACGRSCLASGLSSTSCATTNTTCLCLDQNYENFVTECAMQNCTIKDQLLTQRETSISCGVQYSNSETELIVILVILFAFQSIFFLLRMASRAARLAPWGRDDTTIVIAWILSAGFLGTSLYETTLGVVEPFWARSFSQIDQSLLGLFVCQVLYNLTLGLIKISICFLYMRIFSNPSFQRIMWATQVFIASVIAVFFFAGLAQCQPLSAFWTSWDGVRVGRCFNVNAFAYAHASIHIAIDVWILVLPAIQIWKLNMTLRRKVELTFMFSLGVILTGISIVRLTTLRWFDKDPLSLRSFYATALWSVAELTTGMVVACLPAARKLVSKYVRIALAAAGLSQSEPSHLPQHDENLGSSSAGRQGGGHLTSKFKVQMPALGGKRLSSGIEQELQAGNQGRALRTSEEQRLTVRGWESNVELDHLTAEAKDEVQSPNSIT